ncbi:hypothetical protein GCM10010976_02430 [Bizionia arctica]|uniref:Uncharacterized protein n=1 Tax=Bizionia arctica TaxID=1495645 RepID=A0A917GAW7_9FLAO|nr:hypothetical protein GCM10010976_02430 [Bizionia arctica]
MLLTCILALFFNCKNNEEKPDEIIIDETIEEAEVISPNLHNLQIGCYLYKENGNMINLDITKNDNPVEGFLTYSLKEKDKNIGVFKGQLEGDKLVGNYTFKSEGKESTRQVAFVLKVNQLIEGYGELNEEGTMFKDINAINYSSTTPLTKSVCQQ